MLLVDDEPNISKALKRLLRPDGYTILSAHSGAEALELLKEYAIGVIVSDHRMPVMTGIELLSKVKESYPDITRILLSGFSDIDTVTEAINQSNIYKFIAKPWDDTQLRTTIQEAFEHFELKMENNRLAKELQIANKRLIQKNHETCSLVEQIVNHNNDGIVVVDANRKIIFSNPSALSLLIEHYRVLPGDEFKLPFKENQTHHLTLVRSKKAPLSLEIHSSEIIHNEEQAFLICLHDQSDLKHLHEEKLRSAEKIKTTLLQMAKAISLTIEKIDHCIPGHQNRVIDIAIAIAADMDLDKDILEGITIGGLLLDIGKIHIPNEVLNRAGPVTEVERLLIQQHPVIGYEIIANVDFPWPVAEMVLQHNEHVDGSGYPNGCKGKEIRLESKILGIANVACAMSEPRPYRQPCPISEITSFLEKESGKKFDSTVVNSCIKIIRATQYDQNNNQVSA